MKNFAAAPDLFFELGRTERSVYTGVCQYILSFIFLLQGHIKGLSADLCVCTPNRTPITQLFYYKQHISIAILIDIRTVIININVSEYYSDFR